MYLFLSFVGFEYFVTLGMTMYARKIFRVENFSEVVDSLCKLFIFKSMADTYICWFTSSLPQNELNFDILSFFFLYARFHSLLNTIPFSFKKIKSSKNVFEIFLPFFWLPFLSFSVSFYFDLIFCCVRFSTISISHIFCFEFRQFWIISIAWRCDDIESPGFQNILQIVCIQAARLRFWQQNKKYRSAVKLKCQNTIKSNKVDAFWITFFSSNFPNLMLRFLCTNHNWSNIVEMERSHEPTN